MILNLKETIAQQAESAKNASMKMMKISSDIKNNVLEAIANAIEQNVEDIIFKNEIDVAAANDIGVSKALVDRLTLTKERIMNMAKGVRDIIGLEDPVNDVLDTVKRENGLVIKKIRVPLGVIGIIYESRPNVTVDTAALCIKSGNCVFLRGGSEAMNSNHTLYKIISEAAYANGLPEGAIQFIETTDREAVNEMLQLNQFIDVIIPRGGHKMIEAIVSMSKVPVLQHGEGICHTYVDKNANVKMADQICLNAKVQKPGVCNAMETMLVHKDIAEEFLKLNLKNLQDKGVEVRGDSAVKKIAEANGIVVKDAATEDWGSEYLDLILSVKIVSTLEDAIEHINSFGSGHSEAIVTDDETSAKRFLMTVDSSAVYWNASTRFTDGAEFGMGAEMGISTQKLHARGPMGIKELTSYKYIILGKGQIRG
ncbi:glutamate-5-semialdehyde dehydrogenase [bacterium]